MPGKRRTFIKKKRAEKTSAHHVHSAAPKEINEVVQDKNPEVIAAQSPVTDTVGNKLSEPVMQSTPVEQPLAETKAADSPLIQTATTEQSIPSSPGQVLKDNDLVGISPQSFETTNVNHVLDSSSVNANESVETNASNLAQALTSQTADQQIADPPAIESQNQATQTQPLANTANSQFVQLPGEKNSKKLLLILLCVFLLVLAAGGFYVYKNVLNKKNPGKVVVQNITPTVTQPTSTPTPTLAPPDLTKYTIEVLNGTTTTGEAARVKTILEKDGFMVSNIGNADSSDFVKTVISAKKSVSSAYIEKLKSDLGQSYSVGNIQVLPNTEKSDVVVTIGSAKATSPTPSK